MKKMSMAKKTIESAADKLPTGEQLKLWVRSGGRCAICKEYLLADKFTTFEYNFGEMAHNVGRKRSTQSPRGLDPLPIEDRNKAENVLLLCHTHHKMIDAKVTAGEFTVNDLQKIKKEHEDQVNYLTGLTKDQNTAVIRVMGTIRGATVELSPEHVRKAILADGKWPSYPLKIMGQDCEIDLRGVSEEGTQAYWSAGQRAIDDALQNRLDDAVRKNDIRRIALFAITRIPLLVYLGYKLDDKIPMDLYQKHRDGEESWRWDEQEAPVDFEYTQVQTDSDPTKVAVILNLSGTIQLNELPAEVRKGHNILVIQPVGVTPNRNILRSRRSLEKFAASYHALLSELERSFKGATEIHLFAAIPVTAAVVCGRGLMRDVHPAIILYDRNSSGEYEVALTVNAE